MKLNFLDNKDLPKNIFDSGLVNIDTEFMGLNFKRDRLCLIQIFQPGKDIVHVIHLDRVVNPNKFSNLISLLEDSSKIKIMHYAFADLSQLNKTFNCKAKNIRCTRTMSKITRTFSSSHGLESLVKEVTGKRLNKSITQSYWGGEINVKMLDYAISDVLYLHLIYVYLLRFSIRENRIDTIRNMNKIIPLAVQIYLNGFEAEELLKFWSKSQ